MDPQYTHFHKRCVSVKQSASSRPSVHFDDGTSIEADVVLLANGYKGAGRDAVTGTDPRNNVAFSNAVCYRGLVPVEAIKANGVTMDLSERSTCFVGMDKVRITQ